jgi:acyl-CoA thioester hydrolase
MVELRYKRRIDGLTYYFVSLGLADGDRVYKRVDADVWCRRLPDLGWSVCEESGEVVGRPFAAAGHGEHPPEGVWVSAKDDQAYVYEMTRLTAEADSPVARDAVLPETESSTESDPNLFSVSITARGYEVDANGHVPATTLLAYAQHARWQCLRDAGVDAHELQRTGVGPVSLEEHIRFRHELRPGEEINASCRFVWPEGKSTFSVHQQLRRLDGTLIAEITNVGGLLDLTKRRLIRNPGACWHAAAAKPALLGL